MKHLIISVATIAVLACICTHEAAAQTITGSEGLVNGTVQPVRRAGKVIFADGRRLSADDTFDYVAERCGLPYAQRWNNSAKIYGVGKGLLISSAVTIPVGVVSTYFGAVYTVAGAIGAGVSNVDGEGPDQRPVNIMTGGVLAMYGGIALITVGLSTLVAGSVCVPVGKSRMNDIVNRCNAANSGPAVTMNFGPCPHGVGMTLNF